MAVYICVCIFVYLQHKMNERWSLLCDCLHSSLFVCVCERESAWFAVRRLSTLKDFQAQLSRGHLYSNSLFLSGVRDMLNKIKLWHVGGKKGSVFK